MGLIVSTLTFQTPPHLVAKFDHAIGDLFVPYQGERHLQLKVTEEEYQPIEQEEKPRFVRGFNRLLQECKAIQYGFSLDIPDSRGEIYFTLKEIQELQGTSGLSGGKRTIWVDDCILPYSTTDYAAGVTRRRGFLEDVTISGGLVRRGKSACDSGAITETPDTPARYFGRGCKLTFMESKLRYVF